MTVRVAFDGLDTSVSEELSIIVPPSSGQSYYMPEVGDTVLCIFTETQGFCVGMLQAATPTMSAKDWGLWFDEENQITFTGGKLTIQSKQVFVEGAVTMKSPEIIIDGDLNVSGKINGYTPGSGNL
jgi:hypothetical protein